MKYLCLITVAGALLIAGCANTDTLSGNVYSADQAKRVQTITKGKIVAVRAIKIKSEDSPLGAVAGGVAGGVLGSLVGAGKGRTLATLGGAGAGAVAGNLIQDSLSKTDGVELQILKDSGETIVIVQKADIKFSPGDRVQITNDGRTTTVAPAVN